MMRFNFFFKFEIESLWRCYLKCKFTKPYAVAGFCSFSPHLLRSLEHIPCGLVVEYEELMQLWKRT